MQQERENNKIVNHTQKWDGEVDWIECVQAKERGRRP
jgi:hypothetical protein